MVLVLAFGGGAVGDGVCGALVVAAQTQCAVVVPLGAVVIAHRDVEHWAVAGTFAARDACVVGMEWLGRHGMAYEPGVDHVAFKAWEAAAQHLVVVASRFNSVDGTVDLCRHCR